jgi:type II secretory ATPase GspE/PulE/Tfp pilus assembly ATPase PilB-like protein
MNNELAAQYEQALAARRGDSRTNVSAVEIVDALLIAAQAARASDVHLVPDGISLQVLWRLDGVLQPVTQIGKPLASNVVSRLKVLAELLTYRTEVPQEGRLRSVPALRGETDNVASETSIDADVEMRLSTFPTMHGEKAVVRMFVGSGAFRRLDDLGLPTEVRGSIGELLLESGGVFVVCGPAGSGKTTTIYACLREVADKSDRQRSLVSLEDPIEAALEGVAQSQVNPSAGFDYATGLKSLMRQDPEVILVGEIRDRETAETVCRTWASSLICYGVGYRRFFRSVCFDVCASAQRSQPMRQTDWDSTSLPAVCPWDASVAAEQAIADGYCSPSFCGTKRPNWARQSSLAPTSTNSNNWPSRPA